MFLSKHVINYNNIIKTIISIVFFLLLFIINYFYSLDIVDFKLNDLGVVYLGDEQVKSSTESMDVANGAQTYTSVSHSETNGKLNTSYLRSKSLITLNQDTESLSSYLVDNSQFLSDGFSLSIDGDVIYFNDIEYITWAYDKIIEQMLNDDDLYKVYKSTGEVPKFTRDGKTYSSFSIENDIEINPDYIPASKIINSKEEFMYYIMHGNDEKQIVELSDSNSIKSIQKQYNLTDQEFNLNNPTLSSDQLLYNGTQILVNELNPVINIAYTYDFEQTETINYTTEYVDDPDSPVGTERTLVSGSNGSEIVYYATKVVNGEELDTTRTSSLVTKKPINEKIAQGSFVVPDLGTGNWFWPASGGSVTNDFYGWSVTGRAIHGALDIQSYYGAPIYAADNGTVIHAGMADAASGLCVWIDHNNGYVSKYCHMSAVAATVGTTVSSGQLIGYEGDTGYVTGEHVHFQVLDNGVPVNPAQFY